MRRIDPNQLDLFQWRPSLQAITFKESLAGRHESGYGGERNDCTVQAFAHAARVPYPRAHDIAKAAGRKEGHGFYVERILKQPDVPRHRKLSFRKRMRVATFRKRYPTGRYIIDMCDHAAAILDGVLHDSIDCSNHLVIKAWRFL